jgi:hypothetical protein
MSVTHDQAFFDSTLAFYLNQLNKLDPKLYEPLFGVTWDRDIKLRSDVTFGHEASSFISTNIAGVGTQSDQGKPFISSNTTDIPGVALDGQLTTTPMRLCARDLAYSSVEMERFQMATGGSLDAQKFNALNMLYQLTIDEGVYIGDLDITYTGLLNSAAVTAASVEDDGTGDEEAWALKTSAQIIRDVVEGENACYTATGYNVSPSELLLPPAKFAYIAGRNIDNDSSKSILQYLKENSLSMALNGQALNIRPVKWCTGRGTASVDRMVFYSNNENFVRFPLVPIRRETPYYQGIHFHAPYIWALGEVEIVETTTLIYRDGI